MNIMSENMIVLLCRGPLAGNMVPYTATLSAPPYFIIQPIPKNNRLPPKHKCHGKQAHLHERTDNREARQATKNTQ